mmetsp:Transcript_89964/g.233290  ORF Transcript_89964/g.233290 Transcript_89964/m.233290 type:complete len:919 (+) Transcript_89964:2893-5649(+)
MGPNAHPVILAPRRSGSSSSSSSSIKVCVRLRPFNKAELSSHEGKCVDVASSNLLRVTHPDLGDVKEFVLDKCYDSFDKSAPDFASQQTIMEELGMPLIRSALDGYNNCIFAYGQTGSGKTYTVLGSNVHRGNKGLLPRVAEEIFVALHGDLDDDDQPIPFSATVNYIEVYNEQIRDLLATPEERSTKLDIKHDPKVGAYVKGVKDIPVFGYQEIEKWLVYGTKARSVGATLMNAESSRSHCIFTLEITRERRSASGVGMHVRSKVNLVDLAGSERSSRSKTSDMRLKEGASINQSLTALATVISKLAENGRHRKEEFIPFRNSKLTHLLMDSLGGNSKTVMLAALSPAARNYDETVSTLRFAESVKKVQTKAQRNEESQGSLVDQLREECERLRRTIAEGDGTARAADELEAKEELCKKYGRNFEERLDLAKQLDAQRTQALEDCGLTITGMCDTLSLDPDMPQLVSVNFDPSLCGCLVYFLRRGEPLEVGSSKGCKVQVSGVGLKPRMAVIENEDDLTLNIRLVEGRVLLNGRPLRGSARLQHNDRLIFGYAFCFRVTVPSAAEGGPTAIGGDQLSALFKTALNEVLPESAEAYNHCLAYVQLLGERIGETKALSFFKKLRKLLPLVDEANAITAELRPMARYEFGVEALTDIFHAEDEPDCVVRLKQYYTGARRWRNIVRNKVLQHSVLKLVTNELRDKRASLTLTRQYEPSKTVVLMTVDEFRERLECLRENLSVASWAAPRSREMLPTCGGGSGAASGAETLLSASRDLGAAGPAASAGARGRADIGLRGAEVGAAQDPYGRLPPEEAAENARAAGERDLRLDDALERLDKMQKELQDSWSLVRQLEGKLQNDASVEEELGHSDPVEAVRGSMPAWAPQGLPPHIQNQLVRIEALERSHKTAFKHVLSPPRVD